MGEIIEYQHPDNPEPYEAELAPDWVVQACRIRFETPHSTVLIPGEEGVFKHAPENWWDGWKKVALEDEEKRHLSFIDIFSGETEIFDEHGHTVVRH
jgi:hypothetical protein